MPDPTPSPTPNPSTTALRVGVAIDPYTVKQQIGSGGYSVVYKATDELLNKHVAIKQFLLGDADDEADLREKIMTEARLHQEAAKADPDRLVQVVDVVDGEYGLLLISEYISGPSLEQILAQNTDPMSLKQALGIIAAAAQALNAMHGRGIIHLDLKPANILMPRKGGLKISDFGLATTITDQVPPTAGTVRYMAPELLNNDKIDGRADIYALGMMAYEMLAGRIKFDQAFKLILRDQRNQAVRWVKWHTNPRTNAPPLIDLVPDCPKQVSDLIGRMMDKDPAKRVGSAKDLLSAIKRHFAGKDTGPTDEDTGPALELDSDATTPGDTDQLPTRSNLLKYVIITAVVAVIAAGGAGLYVWNQNRGDEQRAMDEARQTMDKAMTAYREDRLEDALSMFDRIAQDPALQAMYGLHAQAGALMTQGRIDAGGQRFDQAIRSFNQAIELGPPYSEKARALMNETRQAQAFALTVARIDGLIDNRAFGEARKELDTWRDLSATDEEQMALRALGARLEDQRARYLVQELIADANELTRNGRRDEAIELLMTGPQRVGVTELLTRLEAETEADRAVALGESALEQGDPEEAIRQYELAVAALPDNQALQSRLTNLRSEWYLAEGLRMLAQGNTVGADQMLTESLGYKDSQRARDALAQISSSNRRQAFIDAGDAAVARGDFATAETQYNNALDLNVDDALSGKMAGVRVQVLLKQCRAALEVGHIDQAGDLVSQAYQIDPGDTDVAAVKHEVEVRGEYLRHLNAGDAARDRSAFGEAKRHYLRAKEAMATSQVRARLDEAEFDHLLAQARDFIAAKEYNSARAQLQIAASIRTTDEIKELFKLVQEQDTGTDP